MSVVTYKKCDVCWTVNDAGEVRYGTFQTPDMRSYDVCADCTGRLLTPLFERLKAMREDDRPQLETGGPDVDDGPAVTYGGEHFPSRIFPR